jgi:hypothetical protein
MNKTVALFGADGRSGRVYALMHCYLPDTVFELAFIAAHWKSVRGYLSITVM